MENAEVRTEVDELRSVRRQTALWRTSLVVILFLVVVICLAQLRSAMASLAEPGPKQQQFAQILGTKMQEQILPQLQVVGSEAVRSIDFNTQMQLLNKRAPDVASASVKELRLLSTNLPKTGKQVLTSEFEAALQAQASTLQREFPDADEAQITAFLADLTEETQLQLGDVTDTLFTPHITSMNNIMADIEAIKKGEGAAASADVPSWEVAFMLVDIFRADFAALQSEVDSAAAAGKGTK